MTIVILDQSAIRAQHLADLTQGLERFPDDGLADTNSQDLRQRLSQRLIAGLGQKGQLYWLAMEEEQHCGLLILKKLPWDSEHLEVPCAMIEIHLPKVDQSTQTAAASLLIHEAMTRCRLEGIRFLATKIFSDRFAAVHALEDSGFRLMDTELILAHTATAPKTITVAGVDFLTTKEQEIPGLTTMGSLFQMSRFFSDPRISDVVAESLWRASVKDSCAGYADEFMIAMENDVPLGFLTCKDDDSLAAFGGPTIRSFFHVGIASQAQGRGLGTAMITNALVRSAQCTDLTIVETQSRNATALALYQKCGFRVVDSRFAFHLWLA